MSEERAYKNIHGEEEEEEVEQVSRKVNYWKSE
jgi:hypothetical protein